MGINFHRLKSLFSVEKEWRYEEGKLKRRFKKPVYVKAFVAVLVLVVLATSITLNIMKKDIIICDADEEKKLSTFKSTVKEVLEEQNIIIGPYDKLLAMPAQNIKEGMRIEIKRAKPILITVGDKEKQVHTLAETVGEALEEAEIPLGIKDRVEPDCDTAIEDVDSIKVIRVEEQIIKTTKEIPFENEIKKNDKLEKGLVRVIKKGKDGKKEIAERIVFEDGKHASKEVLWEKIIQQPVAAILEEGTKDTLISSRGTVTKFTKALEMTATAYDATFASTGKNSDHPQYGITRSGLKVRPGIVAVDPKVIPLGTWLYVEGYGEALAADTGGAIKGNKIDLYYESPKDVAKYGKKRVKVYILDKPRYKF